MTPNGFKIIRDDSGERVGWWVRYWSWGEWRNHFEPTYRKALAWIRRLKKAKEPVGFKVDAGKGKL